MKVIGRCPKCRGTSLEMVVAILNEQTQQGHGTAVCLTCGHLLTAKATAAGVRKLKDGTLIEKEKLN